MLSFVSVFAIFPLLGVPVIYSWISLWFATVIGATLFHLQHSVNTPYRRRGEKWNFAEAALEGSTYLKIPIILQSFTNGIEYHHIHHLNTNVPSYQIRNCHFAFDELEDKQNHWDIFHINRVDLLLALESMKNVMLDEENGTLLPFP
jgi:omega-6 fatty acid desaturase (delta-12 desaturase)